MKFHLFRLFVFGLLMSANTSFADNRDAKAYADFHQVSLATAKHALILEAHSGIVIDNIKQKYSERISGIYLNHSPTFEIVVRLTGDGQNRTENVAVKALPNKSIPVSFEYGASATKQMAMDYLDTAKSLATSHFNHVMMISYNEKTGNIDIEIKDENNAQTQENIKQLTKAWQHPNIKPNIEFVSYSIGL